MNNKQDTEMAMMMTCREVRDFLVDYMTGTLARAECEEFDRHLAVCSDCGRHVRAAEEARNMSRLALLNLPDPSAEEIPESLLRAIVSYQPSNPSPRNQPVHRSLGPVRASNLFSEVPIRIPAC